MEASPKHALCTLEINVISGENICVDGSPNGENVYVVVRAESLNCCTTKMVQADNGGIVAWNEKFMMDIPIHARSITFEVQCKKYKGVRPIGVARIGLSDFLGAITNNNNNTSDDEISGATKMVSYGLRDWDGRRNGVLHLSARVAAVAAMAKGEKMVSSEQEVCMESPKEKKNSKDNHEAICIPVWLGYCLNFFKFHFIFGLVHRRKKCVSDTTLIRRS